MRIPGAFSFLSNQFFSLRCKPLLAACILVFALAVCLAFEPVIAEETNWSTNNGQLILQGVPEISPGLVARINQYQSTRFAGFLDWAGDDEGLYVRTRFGDISQIHNLQSPGSARRQLTWLENPVQQVERRSRGRELAFTMDRDGNEVDQIYLFDPGKATTTLLTDGQSRNRLIAWSRDGKRLAYQSTRRDGRSNDVWIMDPKHPEKAELVVKASNGHWWGPVDFSKNRKYLLVQQMIEVTDSRIHLLNLRTGEMQLLAGGEENPTANRASGFDEKSTGIYFISNARGRAAELAWRPIEPEGQTEYISAQIPWDVEKFALSDDGKRGAFVTNEGGISRLYLLDSRKRRFSLIKSLPVGLIYNLKFHPDNRRIALTISTAQSPSDVFVLTLGRSPRTAKSLRRWTYSEVGGIDTNRFVEPELAHYPTFDFVGEQARQIPAFIYRPPGAGPHPVIINIHGGPEAQYRPYFNSLFQMWIAELGAAVIAPNIRGSTGYDSEYVSLDDGYKREDAVKDIGALLDWIALQPDLDKNRVAIYGNSYGGYITLASAVHYSDRLRAGIDVVGISNFVSFLESTEEYRRELRRYEYGDERDPETRAFLERISPLNHVERIAIPLLVVQGQNDPRVPASESEQMVSAMRKRGLPVWYIKALNEGHGFDRKENRDVFQQATMMFLQRYLLD
jgi:dipeptidyl aminopeptidase/acylaminoacyl peptidase